MKLLIIRFSSFGDIVQGLSVPSIIRSKHPDAEIHWLVRSDFSEVLFAQRSINKVWSFPREEGFSGLFKLAKILRKEKFTHVYDAHNNLRSHILCWLLTPRNLIRRPKHRWKRFLLFKFRVNQFPKPFIAQRSYIEPLVPWTGNEGLPPAPQLDISHIAYQRVGSILTGIKPFIAIAPQTAWPKKDWPLEHWKDLLDRMADYNFVILGGPRDEACKALETYSRKQGLGQVLNMAGRLSLMESSGVLAHAGALISADTGLLHVADQLGRPCVALIGPTAFGYPARITTRVLETHLDCKPCSKDGRGPCANPVFQKCMIDIKPEAVKKITEQIFESPAQLTDKR